MYAFMQLSGQHFSLGDMALDAEAKEVMKQGCGGSVNVGGLRQRLHYINKCYSEFAVYRN